MIEIGDWIKYEKDHEHFEGKTFQVNIYGEIYLQTSLYLKRGVITKIPDHLNFILIRDIENVYKMG